MFFFRSVDELRLQKAFRLPPAVSRRARAASARTLARARSLIAPPHARPSDDRTSRASSPSRLTSVVFARETSVRRSARRASASSSDGTEFLSRQRSDRHDDDGDLAGDAVLSLAQCRRRSRRRGVLTESQRRGAEVASTPEAHQRAQVAATDAPRRRDASASRRGIFRRSRRDDDDDERRAPRLDDDDADFPREE